MDIGGVALPRVELARVLPDFERFERHLADALKLDEQMHREGGAIPAYVREWSQARIEAVVATLKEVGSLREQTSEQLRAHSSRGGQK